MDQVVEILKTLGINETLFIQFIPFFISYLALSFLIFKPYLRAYEQRVSRTTGEEVLAKNLLQKAEQKEVEYKILAQKLNSEISSIFSKSNEKAGKEVEKILQTAKKDVEKQNNQWSRELKLSMNQAKQEMKKHIPELSMEIQKKFREF